MKVILLLEILCISNSISNVIYPPTVCVIGDVQADYDQQRDPRTLMGTYTSFDPTGIQIDEQVVDISTPIYKHSFFGETGDVAQDQYLFKAKGIGATNGWALSETLPDSVSTVTVLLTCFQDSLFDCIYNKWFWGYNKYQYPIPAFKVLGGDCKEKLCLQNLTIQLKPDAEINPLNPQPGDYSKLDGEFYRQLDVTTGNYEWINKRDPSFRWYYRVNQDPQDPNGNTYNWVYSENNNDKVACAPGYVESPLFCNVYVYAGADYTTGQSYNPTLLGDHMGIPEYAAGINDYVTTWKLGVCGDTFAPTIEPTEITNAPSMAPIKNNCDYNGQTLNIGASVTKTCAFGYYGNNDIGYCLPGGQIGNWEKRCFKISFSDDFIDWNDEQWMVYSSEGVAGDAVLSMDGDSFRFIPENPSLIGIIRSKEQITWPLRVRATVEKRRGECNLWAISLGQAWLTRSPYSSRVSWFCKGGQDNKQLSLYNNTFRLYDSKCWNDDIDDTMDVIYTLKNSTGGWSSDTPGSKVTTSSNDCATLKLSIADILTQNPWENAYLWLGSYGETEDYDIRGKINESMIGRFNWIGYTKFFSDFDGTMDNIWNNNNEQNLMNIGDKIISNTDLYQFTIPFSIRLGIKKPDTNGVFAHFVSLGGAEYVSESTDNIVQIVWRDDAKARLAYTSNAIYRNPSGCNWQNSLTFDVTIEVDTEKIKIFDTLCNSVLVAQHDLDINQTNIALGFINDNKYGVGDTIEFTYIEVYQLPLSYVGDIANQLPLSDIVINIIDVLSPTPRPSQPPNTLAPTISECPEGCVRYYPDGCFQCLCGQDGKYDITTCTNENGCTGTILSAYCDLCDTDTEECNAGDDVERDEDNLCEFKECKDPQGNGNSVYYICVMGNVIGVFMLMILKMV